MEDGKENRIDFIDDLAIAKSKAGKITASNALKQIQENEETRASWSRIHRMDGTARTSAGLTKVLAPNKYGYIVEMTSQEDLEHACLDENSRRFTQTKGTPLTTGPLLDDIGLLGRGKYADEIMLGKYRLPPEIDPTF